MPSLLKKIKNEMKNAKKHSPGGLPRDPKNYPKLRLLKLESRASIGIKSLTYKSIIKGESKTDYITFVQFFDIIYNKKKTKEAVVPVKVAGNLWYHPKANILENRVSIKCSCQDFRFMFEKPLYDDKSLIGRFRKYIRTPGSSRPPKNPQDVMGFCKHVHSMLNSLNKAGVIEEVNKL